MQNFDGIDFIPKVFERAKPLANFFGRFIIPSMNCVHHLHGLDWRHTDTTAGKTTDAEIPQVNDRWLFTNSTDDSLSRKDFEHLFQIIILSGIIPHDSIFQPGDNAILFKRLDQFRLQPAIELQIEHQRFADSLSQFPNPRRNANLVDSVA